ncbi:MAG: GHMP kinase [Chitinophagales bacterium]|nr:GHMP kinase [Chitinophagales bacterium]
MLLFDEKANGKILLTAEYVVLDGALALALPTKLGQQLKVYQNDTDIITYTAYNFRNEKWFEAKFDIALNLLNKFPTLEEKKLQQIFKAIASLNTNVNFINYRFESYLEFPNNYGLGSSSTIIALLAKFFKVNPYQLLAKTFGGSGYDIACAFQNQAILYQLIDNNKEQPKVETVDFNPSFIDKLFFVHLNEKQNSQEAVARYKNLKIKLKEDLIKAINEITNKILNSNNLVEFCNLLEAHEQIISIATEQATIKSVLFDDFNGTIKSLGAWNGDFILAVGNENEVYNYFQQKGFSTIIPYKKLIL